MVSSMRGNDVGDVVDGNVASKVEDAGDNYSTPSPTRPDWRVRTESGIL